MTTNLSTDVKSADTAVSKEDDDFLRASRIVDAINENLPAGLAHLPKIPNEYVFRKRDRGTIATAFHGAFELSGGVSALMLWAAQNPDKFYPLYAKLAGTEVEHSGAAGIVNFISTVPPSPLNTVNIRPNGEIYTTGVDDDGELPE